MNDRIMDNLITHKLLKSAGIQNPVPAIACWTCHVRHPLPPQPKKAKHQADDFRSMHAGHQVDWHIQQGVAGIWHGNANVQKAESAVNTFTVTNLHSTASSATVGWQGAVVDNSSGLYLDAQLFVLLDFANTAPGSSKAAFVFAYGGIESGVYSYPASGSEGTITLTDVAVTARQNMPKLGVINYTVQDAVIGGWFSVRTGFAGWLPTYWGPAIINFSGAALAGSGNTVKWRNTYFTVTG